MSGSCPTCGDSYESLGTHFRYNEDHRETVTAKQHEIITGLLLGDGCLCGRRSDRNNEPFLTVTFSQEKAVDYLRNIFGWLAREKQSVYTDGREYYRFETRSHPDLRRYLKWYQPEKVWPSNSILSGRAMKWLYVSDGTYDTTDSHNRIMIACAKEGQNESKIRNIFSRSGHPVSRVYHYEREGRKDDFQLHFNKAETQQLFEYMGEAPPGFEYKWPNQNV